MDESDWQTWLSQVRELAQRDLTAARRAAMLRILWQEAYFTCQGLTSRVEDLLGRGCFGKSPRAAFARDIAAVRRTLSEKGYTLSYNRNSGKKGYSIAGRPPLDERLAKIIAGSIAEVDDRQMAITRRLTAAQRFWQGRSMVEAVERVAAYRLCQRQPSLTLAEARRVMRERKSWYA